MQKQNLETTIRRKILPRSLLLVFGLSVVLIVIAAIFVQSQINNRHIAYAEDFILNFNESLESLQQQVNNLAKNDLIINSIIDDSNRDAYLPVFFRSLELTVTENVAILFTDFSGEIITGKNTELYQQNLDKFAWKPPVLEAAARYLNYSENGIMVAAPILYSSSTEGAIVTYVQSLQSMVKHTFDDHLILLVSADKQVLYSSDPYEVSIGSSLETFNTNNWYMHEKKFGDNRVISLELLTSAYSDMLWLVVFMAIALIAVLAGSLYSTRLSSRMASEMLKQLQSSISFVSNGTGAYTDSLIIENEPIEFERIRKNYDDTLRDLARTAISRDRFENVINSLDEVLMVIDNSGNLILSNNSLDQFLEAVGYTLPTDLGKILPFSFIKGRDNDKPVIECVYGHVAEAILKNGQYCEIRWTRNDYLNEHGQLFGSVIIGTNITESKRLESELLIKNKAIDEAQTSIVISDALQQDSPITYVNNAFETLTGYSAKDVMGKNCRFLQGKNTEQGVVNEIRKALSNKKAITTTLINYKKDGAPFYNQLILSPVFNEKGVVTHILGLQSDVTERENTARYNKQAKIKAEESAQLKSDFLASMSHEIRTPMNGIMGMLSLLLNSQLNKEQRHHASLANSSADSLLSIINDILDFSKIEAGKLDIEPIEFDLLSELGEIVDSMAVKAQEKGIELILDTKGIKIQRALGDTGRIRQILINLLGNAIKFTESGSIVIQAMLEMQSDNLLFICSVQDNGIGIEQNRLPLIFNSFTQADASTTRKFGGTGLGLAICKQLVELMGGNISVDSSVGLGSTFSFNLILGKVIQTDVISPTVRPLATSDSVRGQNKVSHQPAINERVRILLVEDNYTNQVLAEALLNNMGYPVDIVEDGEQALAALNETHEIIKYELILMDCQMPVMDGFEATQKIRNGDASENYKEIPIVAMTANAIKGDREACLSIGMSDYISKPVDASILQEKLLMWLPERASENEVKQPQSTTSIPSVCWDYEQFLARLSGHEDLLYSVVEAFLADTPILIKKLERAVFQQDLEQIMQIAHTLKGCCGNISAQALTDATSNIELAAQEESCDKLGDLWLQFAAEKQVLFDRLQASQEGKEICSGKGL